MREEAAPKFLELRNKKTVSTTEEIIIDKPKVDSKPAIAMKRIMGVEKKNRIQVKIGIEKEIFDALKDHKYHVSDLINVLIEKELKEKGLL